ncbi:hypothetical protein SKAU_G00120050 [Synaphobranchus kaupii]|uniref:Uncharacterized protein n=1 Tax=Synaphobranchus kaupii TaxID=118154 RepID=A0A9Q1FNL5_SYNKA|nr:hypothetical protein SKAU_G00120050 [Synaphobranchus kaupii]
MTCSSSVRLPLTAAKSSLADKRHLSQSVRLGDRSVAERGAGTTVCVGNGGDANCGIRPSGDMPLDAGQAAARLQQAGISGTCANFTFVFTRRVRTRLKLYAIQSTAADPRGAKRHYSRLPAHHGTVNPTASKPVPKTRYEYSDLNKETPRCSVSHKYTNARTNPCH